VLHQRIECDDCKQSSGVILIPGEELILCAACHDEHIAGEERRGPRQQQQQQQQQQQLQRQTSSSSPSASSSVLLLGDEGMLLRVAAAVASSTLALMVLHVCLFRYDEASYLLTNSFDPPMALIALVSLLACIAYVIALPCLCVNYCRGDAGSALLSTKWVCVVMPLLMTVVIMLKLEMDRNLLVGFSRGQLRPEGSRNLAGKVVLITGANSGVGLSVATSMARLGATVVMACRSVHKCKSAAAQVGGAVEDTWGGGPRVLPMQLDLASFDSIHSFADSYVSKFRRLDILFANAGFAAAPAGGKLHTAEGFELGLGTMHFGHFLLFQRLRYTLEKTARAPRTDVRVVSTSSAASQYTFMGAWFHDSLFHEPPGDLRGEITTATGGFQYGRAKLANVLFTRHLQKVLPWITTCACHVGAVDTSIWVAPLRFLQPFVDAYTRTFMRSPEEGARIVLKCALDQSGAVKRSGAYLNGMGEVVREEGMSSDSRNATLAWRLWEVSERVTQRYKD
jgi:NAD(P)-dependent dehydrogenase (short-subunit alcohol dehydrogenase family)